MPQSPPDDLPIRLFKNPDAWEKWLASNYAKSPGIWMRIAKKASGISSVNYQEALDVALCWGWIDGQKRPYDETSWLQRFTRRGPKSVWSQINTGKADALIKSGRMRPRFGRRRRSLSGAWARRSARRGVRNGPLHPTLAGSCARRRNARHAPNERSPSWSRK